MKNILTSLLLFTAVIVSAQVTTVFPAIVSYPQPDSIHWSGHTTVFIGDSWTLGIAATIPANRWTTLFAAAKNTTENNNGVSGQTMQTNCSGSTFNSSTIPTYNSATHAALFIALGLNDVGLNNGVLDTTAFGTKYRSDLADAIAKGWPPLKIFCITPGWCFSYNDWVGSCSGAVTVAAPLQRQLDFNTSVIANAAAYGARSLDVYTPMKAALNSSYYNSGGAHLIDNGMLFYKNLIVSLMPN